MSRVMQCELPISNDAAYKGRVRIWDNQGCVPQCSPNGHYYSVRAESEELAAVYTNTRVWALHATQDVLCRLASPYSHKNHLLAISSIARLSHLTDIGETDPHTYDQIMRLAASLALRVSVWIHNHIHKLEVERDLLAANFIAVVFPEPQD